MVTETDEIVNIKLRRRIILKKEEKVEGKIAVTAVKISRRKL